MASGLRYQVMQDGSGAKPLITDTVVTHYHGTLLDGTVFDSSVERGESISFPVGGVIAGWTEALQLMPVGSKWKLIVPSELAYGERGAGPSIGPNTDLIFDEPPHNLISAVSEDLGYDLSNISGESKKVH